MEFLEQQMIIMLKIKTPTEAGVQEFFPSAYSLIVIRCKIKFYVIEQ